MLILNKFLLLYKIFIIGLVIKLNEASDDSSVKSAISDNIYRNHDDDTQLCDKLNCNLVECKETDGNYVNSKDFRETYCCTKCANEQQKQQFKTDETTRFRRHTAFADDSDDDDDYVAAAAVSLSDEKCKNINCSDARFAYYEKHLDCPLDSNLIDATPDEADCCSVKHKCECRACGPKLVCKVPGATLEATLVLKGTLTPEHCCDLYLCTSIGNSSCLHNGVVYADKQVWNDDSCTTCSCQSPMVRCKKENCPELTCEIKRIPPHNCCPVCTGECHSNFEYDKKYKSGESWTEKDDCTHCVCRDGHKFCYSQSCTPLSCQNPIKIPGHCCKQCKDEENRKIKYPPHCNSIISNFKCNLTCEFGFRLNGNRCPMCKCSEEPIGPCNFPCTDNELAYMPLNNRLCNCTQRCPNDCNLYCPNGYLKAPNGCDLCKCNDIPLHTQTCNALTNPSKGKSEGGTWFDGCRQCMCHENRQYCSLISCNIKCTKPIYRPDSCCPICSEDEVTDKLDSPVVTICYSSKANEIYSENETWNLDECTKCVCKNGIVLCQTSTCAASSCPKVVPVAAAATVPNSKNETCCPTCSNIDQIKLPAVQPSTREKLWSCFDSNQNKKPHGTVWKENDCLTCKCLNGESKCFNEVCPKMNCAEKVFKKGQCCPYCLTGVKSPFVLANLPFDTVTPKTSTNKPQSAMTTTVILIVLIVLVLFLIVIIILLVSYILRKNSEYNSECHLTGSSIIDKNNNNNNVQNRQQNEYHIQTNEQTTSENSNTVNGSDNGSDDVNPSNGKAKHNGMQKNGNSKRSKRPMLASLTKKLNQSNKDEKLKSNCQNKYDKTNNGSTLKPLLGKNTGICYV